MPSVSISPRFFRNAFLDYRDPLWAFTREIMQNAIDSGATEIAVGIDQDPVGDSIRIKVQDNGCGMTLDVLTNKLLTLGESGKEFRDGSVGGFGKAKEVLYFAQRRYTIRTGFNWLTGVGGDYNIKEQDTYQQGTIAEVWWSPENSKRSTTVEEMAGQFERFISLTGKPGVRMSVNGKTVTVRLFGGKVLKDLSCGTVRGSKQASHTLVVRHGGVPMYTRWISPDRTVIVDLTGPEYLASNRDGLRGPSYAEVEALIDSMTTNKRSALRKVEVTMRRWHGDKVRVISCRKSEPIYQDEREVAAHTDLDYIGQMLPQSARAVVYRVANGGQTITEDTEEQRVVKVQFYLKNSTGLQTPDYFLPTGFGHYAESLLSIWIRSLVVVHESIGLEAEFAVGFILDEDRDAEHDGGDGVYYLNPATVVKQKNSDSRSFRKRFKLTDWHKIAALAAHEVCHGAGFGPHDEDYASKLTDVMAEVLANAKRFRGGN